MLTVWFPAICPLFIEKNVKSLCMVSSNPKKVSFEISLTVSYGFHMLCNSHIKHLMLCFNLFVSNTKGGNVTNLLEIQHFRTIGVYTDVIQ
jgi:hypothetical protein